MNLLDCGFPVLGFMPHGHCYLWDANLLWLHVLSDTLITVAYYSIPITLVYFVRRRRDLEFHWMFLCFALFIVACGTTHLMEIWNIWHPDYWLAGSIKAVTALASVPTAILLVHLVPRALALPKPSELRRSNEALRAEVIERKRAVEKAESLRLQVERHAALLENSNKELEAFSYTASHDLRAPLRHIQGFVELVKETDGTALSEKGRRYMEQVASSARQMGTLIDELLAFSRTQRSAMNITPVDLGALWDEAQAALAPDLRDRKVVWRKGVLPTVPGDHAMLRQVLINLMSNAVKYTRPRAVAEIEFGCQIDDAQEAVAYVRDNGVGFDMAYADKLFGVFQRLHHADEFEGTGIGLANVRRIIERHGGRVWAEGVLDHGATFYFALPKQSPVAE